MKKSLIYTLVFFVICWIVLILFLYFKPITILGNVKVYRRWDRLHYIYYKDTKIGYMSALDSWYVQNGKVYGSISDMNANDDKVDYFYIDTCNNEVYITPYYKDFENFFRQKKD